MYAQMARQSSAQIDLRSDTVTLPSPAMREAMAAAPVGDDVYGEDPTVNRLEQEFAALVGKEAAVFVSSGTMGNLTALLAHAQRGTRVICGDECHIYHYEGGGASALGGLVYQLLPTSPDGTLDLAAVAAAAAPSTDSHWAPPGVVCLENTHNRMGGTVLSAEYMQQVKAIANQHGLPLHLDGARLWNAAVASGSSMAELAASVDTLTCCLSKGLAAPVGSLVAGNAAFAERVRRVRKMLGGGMRQAGIIAAAGLVALHEMVDRLAEDHQHARILAEGLAGLPGISVDLSRVQTDIVRFRLDHPTVSAEQFQQALRERGILIGSMGRGTFRAVTHYGITADDIEQTLSVAEQALAR
jgi:threonine aldolase